MKGGGGAPDQQVISDVRGYAQETRNGYDHVLRWMRVLGTFGALDDMTAAEARGYADQHLAGRWGPVAAELAALESAGGGYEPDQQVVADVRGYAQETRNGYDHVLRWMRVLATFGALDDMTAAEARGYADQHLAERWGPVAAELERLGGVDLRARAGACRARRVVGGRHRRPGPSPGERVGDAASGHRQRSLRLRPFVRLGDQVGPRLAFLREQGAHSELPHRPAGVVDVPGHGLLRHRGLGHVGPRHRHLDQNATQPCAGDQSGDVPLLRVLADGQRAARRAGQ